MRRRVLGVCVLLAALAALLLALHGPRPAPPPSRGPAAGSEDAAQRAPPALRGTALRPVREAPVAASVGDPSDAPRIVRWPLVAGDVPVPEDGATLVLRPRPDARGRAPLPSHGYVAAGNVVVEDWPLDPGADAMAVARDGALGWLGAVAPGASTGPPVTFHRARTIRVHLTYPDGEAAEGIRVFADALAGFALCPAVATDRTGTAHLESLPVLGPGLAQVTILGGGTRSFGLDGIPIGLVDLGPGDATLEAVVGREREIVIACTVDGERGLPPGACWVRILADEWRGEDLERDAVAGTLRARWTPPKPRLRLRLTVDAPGYPTAVAVVSVEPGLEPIQVPVELARGGTLFAEIRLPPDGRHRIGLERYTAEHDAWEHSTTGTVGAAVESEADASGRIRYAPLVPGRYRIRDRVSAAVSAPVEVRGGETAVVVLDLSTTYFVKGRVEAPQGAEGGLSIVAEAVVGEPAQSRGFDDRPLDRSPRTAGCRADGTFALRLPAGIDVRLVPAGRFLRPAPDGGTVTVTGPRDDVVLKLVRANVATLHLAAPSPFAANPGQPRSCRALLFDGEPDASPRHEMRAWVDGDTVRLWGHPAGRWTVWVDVPPFEPLVLRHQMLAAGDQDLGTVAVSEGASVEFRLVAPPGAPEPFAYATGYRLEAPRYQRMAYFRGTTGRLYGLAPGRWQVFAGEEYDGSALGFQEVLELESGQVVRRTLEAR